jgi:endoglucanase
VRAGVERADGFHLNASNYQYTANQEQYGTWISRCIAQGNYAGRANRYWNGGPAGTKIADLLGPWTGGPEPLRRVERHHRRARTQHVGHQLALRRS